MDVKTAFLNGDLEEEIYMNQPEGFIEPGMENKVCKLVKSLYGLKQTPKQWHDKFDQVFFSYGFQFNNSDKCVYVKKFDDNSCVILYLCVDDILIFGSNLHVINDVKSLLSSNFEMKDLGLVDIILGIKLIKNHDSIVLTQSHYIENC
uniref:Retrovirus-related Pol polyprotein from transposon TNT 1-94 n=1 Tax=Cajanus cajan TaxID=3821 RepID=A0A151TZ13_CAJCA|nr:Retrovirus-related Pol polyprotein from transposon TNT 1-94 [Cajanus cajan]